MRRKNLKLIRAIKRRNEAKASKPSPTNEVRGPYRDAGATPIAQGPNARQGSFVLEVTEKAAKFKGLYEAYKTDVRKCDDAFAAAMKINGYTAYNIALVLKDSYQKTADQFQQWLDETNGPTN